MSPSTTDTGQPSTPTPADVARIAAMSNRVIRNLEITEAYAQLSAAMRERIGPAADWCTFAVWASKQAGSTIRGEDLLNRLQRQLGQIRLIHCLVGHADLQWRFELLAPPNAVRQGLASSARLLIRLLSSSAAAKSTLQLSCDTADPLLFDLSPTLAGRLRFSRCANGRRERRR